jgi:hypothetical protein
MKKTSHLRLKLHRETLGNLTSDQMGAIQGGAASFVRTCGCPPPPTAVTCATACGGSCSFTTTTC